MFIYILGNPRSGTSLLRLMLNAHSDVVAPPECGFIQWNMKLFQKKTFLTKTDRMKFIDGVINSKKMETWGITSEEISKSLDLVDIPTYSNYCKAVLKTYARVRGNKPNPKVLVDKNNYYLSHLDEIQRAIPDAYYIHLVRDVRDVALSYQNLNKMDGLRGNYVPKLDSDIEKIASIWKNNNYRVSRFLIDKKCIQIRYEDLITSTKSQLIRLASFLEIPYDDKMERYYEFNDEPMETLPWKTKTLNPLDVKRVKAYQTELDPLESGKLWSLCRSLLEDYGYEK